MVSILIWLLIFMIVAGVIYYVLTLLPIPEPFKNIVMILFILIILLIGLFKLMPLLGVSL